MQLKDNQKNLLREVSEGCDFLDSESSFNDIEKSRNRIESRITEVYDIANPKTGDSVSLAGKYVPHFKPGKELRDRVNKGLENEES